MRSILAAIVALMFATGALFAADTMTQQGGSTGGASSDQSMSQEKTITATVQNVQQDQKKISVTGPQGNKAEYTLNNSTVITTPSGEQKTIGDLKNGSKVTITYTGTAENPTVTNVTIQQGK